MPIAKTTRAWILWASTFALAACGGGSNTPPVAQPFTATMDEDGTLTAQLTATDPDGDLLNAYSLSSNDANATYLIDAAKGTLTIRPAANFNGHLHAMFTVSDGSAVSVPAAIDVDVTAVNDPPALAAIEAQDDSADTYPTSITVDPGDVDGDVSEWSAESADPAIADVSVDPRSHSLLVTPHQPGSTLITVTVGDGQYQSATSFSFTVGTRTSRRSLTTQSATLQTTDAAKSATTGRPHLLVSNTTPHTIHFALDVNDTLQPGTADDVIVRAAALPDAFPQEPLPYKIAREVARVMGRGLTLTEATWIHEPSTLMNSIGFGYCDDVASAFAYLARHAGFDARVWTLGGHVVPEVYLDGRWEMLDPDLGVYYTGADPTRALGIDELAAEPARITDTSSLRYLASKPGVAPNSVDLADIYATTGNNLVWDYYDAPVTLRSFEFELPAGGYLDLHEEDVTDWADIFGTPIQTRSTVTFHLPAGYTGPLPSALVLASAAGDGSLRIGDSVLPIGSDGLRSLLATFAMPRNDVAIVTSMSTLDLTFYINPAATDYSTGAHLLLRGTLIGGLTTELQD